MADVHSKDVRSHNMSKIRGKNTKPELIVRKHLFANGFRFRLHVKTLPGRPDIVLAKYRTIVQIHGCFWHGHSQCRFFVVPKTRTDWWREKIIANKNRDILIDNKLNEIGWKVITIWECELKPNTIQQTLNSLVVAINQNG